MFFPQFLDIDFDVFIAEKSHFLYFLDLHVEVVIFTVPKIAFYDDFTLLASE